ncbi:hypothetical protein F1643_18220 [Azospirillum sp. INR13]|uniref:hypothetical protein n=1 Tax=Azospirillum sp. INR13 TaxID=2596919 RepID=UPI0018923625|nr:hypothetical protein [Azospirillum sp. INR13]MBF5096027.1 hypothetical protein [Azospirillum sp. INR13]
MRYIASRYRAGLMGPGHVEAVEQLPGLVATVAAHTAGLTAAQATAGAALPRAGGALTGPVTSYDLQVMDAATVSLDVRLGQVWDWTVPADRTLGPLLAVGLADLGAAAVWEGAIFLHATSAATVTIDPSYKLPSGAAYTIVMAAGDVWRVHILYRRRRGRASASIAKETP